MDELPIPPKYTEADLKAQAEAAAEKGAFVERSRRFARPRAIVAELSAIPKKDLSNRQKGQYVDALAELGRFDEAYKLSKDVRFKNIAEKLRGGKTKCKCKDFETVELIDGQVTPIKHSRFFVKREVWDVENEKFVGLVTCNVCGK